MPNGASVCQGSETPPAPPCLAPAWARGTNLRRLGDFCILFCFALRCPCNCLPNPACVTFGADGAQRLCPGRLGQGLGLLLQTSGAEGCPASCCCPQLLRAELLHGEKAVPIIQGAGAGCSPQPQSRGAPRSIAWGRDAPSPFFWVCVVPALPSPCPVPSPSPISLRFSALSLVSNFPSWQQFWGRDRPGSFRLFSDPGLALAPFAPSLPARVHAVLPGTSQLPPECSVPEPPPLAWVLPRRAPSIVPADTSPRGALPAAVGSGFSPSAPPGSQFSSKSPCQQEEETRKCSETASGSTVPS